MGLAVEIDGVPVSDDDARALWERFSAWMEEHRGDLAGFAAKEGYASAHPGIASGRPILRLSRTERQQPYAPASPDRGAKSRSRGKPGGSGGRNAPRQPERPPARNTRK
jgi:hypothetical protein